MALAKDKTFEAAERRRDALRGRLEIARADLAALTSSVERARATYRDALARAEIDGGEAPSRSHLAELQGQLPAAEDRVAALELALADLEFEVRVARADVLAGQAELVRAEATRRQARIHELQPQVEAMQREIGQHSSWISNEGPVKATQLDAEALQLRSRA